MKTKILITGGCGFIGSSLADKLVENPNNQIIIADNLLTGKISNLPSSSYDNWKFIQCDVNDRGELLTVMVSHQFDYVFHYAAVVGVKRTLENPLLVLRDIEGIQNILEFCKNTGVKRIFFASSSEVYGESMSFPQNEISTPLNSRLPYAVVKNVGESFCRSYAQEFGLPYTLFRFFNTYGPKQSPDFVVSKFLQAAIRNEKITIYGDGAQTRTFCYIDDNIDACLATMDRADTINDVFNIGSDVEITVLELAQEIISITNSRSEICFLPPLKEGDMKRRVPDLAKMKDLLHRNPVSLKDGLSQIVNKLSIHNTR